MQVVQVGELEENLIHVLDFNFGVQNPVVIELVAEIEDSAMEVKFVRAGIEVTVAAFAVTANRQPGL